MELSYDAEQQAFREEVRAFMQEMAPADIAEKAHTGQRYDKEDLKR